MAADKGIRAGGAFVEIGANLKALHKGLSQATVNVGSFAAGVGKTIAKSAKYASFALAGIGAGLAGATAAFLATDKRLLSPEESAAADALRESLAGLTQSGQTAAAALITTLQPAVSVVIDIVRHGLAAFREWIATQGDLIAGITSFVKGVRDSLASGDIAGAARIVWQGIKVAWQTGIVEVMAATLEWKTSLQQTMSEAWLGIVNIAGNVWNSLKDGWRSAADFVVDVYSAALRKVAKAVAALAGKLGFDKIAAGAAGFAATEDSAARTRQDERARRDADIAKQRRRDEEAFGETVAEANRMIAESNRAALKGAQDDLARAKAELDTLVGNAAKKAEDVGRKLPDVVKLGDVKTSVIGTFAGAAAAGMDQSIAPMKKVEEHTKKTADATQKMADTLADIRDSGGLVFA